MKKILPAAVAVLLLAGCSSAPADEPAETKESTQTQQETEAPSKTEPEAVKIGTPVVAGDWEITINSWNPDVNAEVEAAAPDLYEAPEEGMSFALMNVTMKYKGTETGDNSSVQIRYVPEAAGVTSDLWRAFGTTPGENKLTYETLTPGGEVTGDALYLIEAGTTGKFEVTASPADEPVIVTL
jgi:hypothetical protein